MELIFCELPNLLDPIAPEMLYPMLAGAGDKLYAQRAALNSL